MNLEQKIALQQVILPVFAVQTNGLFRPYGTAFVIAGQGQCALIMTAAHVMRGILQFDKRDSRQRQQSHFLKDDTTLRRTKILVQYRQSETEAYFAEVVHTMMNDPLDIAVGVANLPDDRPPAVSFKTALSIDSSPPRVGTQIISAGYGDMKVLHNEVDYEAERASASLELKLDYRHGEVTKVFGSGAPGLSKWPCFQIDSAISPGMSGGPVLDKSYGDRMVVRGVNACEFDFGPCRDPLDTGSGGMAAMLWPSLAIEVPVNKAGSVESVRLLSLVQNGHLRDYGDPERNLIGIPEPGIDDFRMEWKQEAVD